MDLSRLGLICFGGGGSAPAPPPIVYPDDPSIKREAEEAAKKERELARKRKGRRSTIMTSGMGLKNDPETGGGRLKEKLGA